MPLQELIPGAGRLPPVTMAETPAAEPLAIPAAAARLLAALRIMLGIVFLWAFLDKAFGLGYATKPEAAWLQGGSPTRGFLSFGTNPEGPLAGAFTGMAGHPVVDWLFMLGLLAIGVALLLGIGLRVAAWSGAAMLVLMWLAIWPMQPPPDGSSNNPVVDDHLVYAVALFALAALRAGDTWGLGRRWRAMPVVQRHRVLE